MFGLFVRRRVFGGCVDFVQDKLAGVVWDLQHVEAAVAGFLYRSQVVQAGGGNEIVDVVGFDVDVNEGNVHG